MNMNTVESYIYRGPKRIQNIPTPPVDNLILNEASFIVNTSSTLYKEKSKGAPALYEYNNSDVIDYQLDLFHKICKNPQIIYVTGYDSYKFAKHRRRNEFLIVENKFFDLYGSIEDLRLGINCANKNNIFYIQGNVIPLIPSMKDLYRNGAQSTCLYNTGNNNEVGVIVNKYNIITNFRYESKNKVTGVYYICPSDASRIRRKLASDNVPNNIFDYEILADYKLIGIHETKTITCEN